ncbi:MAG: beta-ketoacyl-ACP synthase II [Chitinispirillia bacterium]|nr:beta-ketoacyl-ACP synthase II [Chitinispirillia bacterium]
MSNRVVITGLGVTSPVGNDVNTFWASLCAGRSGIDAVSAFDTSDYPTKIAGEVRDLDFGKYMDAKEVKRNDRVILLGIAGAAMAIEDSGLDLSNEDLDRIGVIVSSGVGGMKTMETEQTKLIQKGPSRVSPFLIPMMIADMPAGRISMQYGLRGPNYAVVSACASGGHSIGDAFIMIKSGMMDVALAGGTEAAITPLSFAGFCSMKAMSTRNDIPAKASSPFDIKRDGFVMGEGSGVVVLESLEHALKRGAKIYGEMLGYGATADAHHLTQPAPEGAGAQASMRMALKSGQLSPDDIDYINAHGTSTPFNDMGESFAISKVFGGAVNKLSISSTKSMTGHLLGASGGIEFIASILAIRDGIIPPTINYEDPDPECPLNYTPNAAVKREVRCAMSNSFGFGGHNVSLVVGRYMP